MENETLQPEDDASSLNDYISEMGNDRRGEEMNRGQQIFNGSNSFNNFHRPKFTFKDIEESFEKFNGDEEKNIEEWIDEFEDQSTMFQWGDLEKLIYGRRLLTGTAKLFVNSELKPKTWEQFKFGLIREFKIVLNAALIHRKLSETKKQPNESFNEYCYKMVDIAQPAKLDAKAMITYIVDGISDHVNNKLFLYHSTSLTDLKERMKIYNKAHPVPKRARKGKQMKSQCLLRKFYLSLTEIEYKG